tara:strand:+ start:648 stop:1160 length:513 start_codon:yes stop_codon:yes gene_type:complete
MNVLNNYYIKKDERDIMNNEISNRFLTDTPLKPNINVRPVQTKYVLFPIVDGRLDSGMKKQYLEHYVETNFAPVTDNGPVNLTNTHIDTSSELRGLNVPLHKGDLPLKYTPSKTSDMYIVNVPKGKQVVQPHPALFAKDKYKTMAQQHVTQQNIGKELLHNHTRTQLRNL